MGLVEPSFFDTKNLYLDVRLTAIIAGKDGTVGRNFSGIRTINTSFYKDNIGFGITDIQIDINTSLQPVIKISFKDLYGATVFGGQFNKFGIDYSQLFAWPPPKFKFQFKGFLGGTVTWLLNLKQYSTAFEPADGSYKITAEFIPNQFGFLADMPYLYLRSIKKLREILGDEIDAPTTFDLIEIGNKVTEISEKVNGNYETITEKLYTLSTNPESVISTEIMKTDEAFVGQIQSGARTTSGGQEIEGFQSVQIPSKVGSFEINPTTVTEKVNSGEARVIRRFIVCNTLVGGSLVEASRLNDLSGKGYEFYKVGDPDSEREKYFTEAIGEFIKLMRENLELVEELKQAEIYVASDGKIGQLTISNVMQTIARDSGYLMGAILDYGLLGEANNPNRKNEDQNKDLVGVNYPLIIEQSVEKAETPAIGQFGIEDYELKLIQDFTTAVVESINREGEDTLLPNFSFNERSRIKNRITNLEILYPNPYKGDPIVIARTMILRSGVGAFLTGSDDPNNPATGDIDDIKTLAEKDFENVKPFLNDIISDGDQTVEELKVFCDFFRKVFSDDMEGFSSEVTGVDDLEFDDLNPDEEKINQFRQAKLKLFNEEEATMDDILNKYFGTGSALQQRTGVDPTTMRSEYVIINGKLYLNPFNNIDPSSLNYIVFEGADATEVLQKAPALNYEPSDNSAEGAFEIKYTPENDNGLPNAVTNIFGANDINTAMGRKKVYSWRKIRDFTPDFGGVLDDNELKTDFLFGYQSNGFWQFPTINRFRAADSADSTEDADGSGIDDDNENTWVYKTGTNPRYAAMPLSNPNDSRPGSFGRVFDFFNESKGSRLQRAYLTEIARLCFEELVQVQNELISKRSNLTNKFTNAEYDIYKQFHSLYQQWSSMAIGDSDQQVIEGGSVSNLRGDFSSDFGDHHFDYNLEKSELRNTVDSDAKTAFVYQFPLQSIQEGSAPNIKIKDAIVNIDSLKQASTDANTTVLNVIQNLCTKNKFTFIPIPGNPGYDSTTEIFTPQEFNPNQSLFNVFHVMFLPTPESRTNLSNTTFQTDIVQMRQNVNPEIEGMVIKFGSPDNQIVKSVNVDTVDNKVTAESIINLQALVDNNTQTKQVNKNCSMLSLLAGRSYKSKITMLGNAKLFPTQFFFLDRSPLFGGLYQIMSVSHNISPNNMESEIEGIRMRFANSSYGAVHPITKAKFEEYKTKFGLGVVSNKEQSQTTTTTKEVRGEKDIFSEGGGDPDEPLIVSNENRIEVINDLIIDRSIRLNSNQYVGKIYNKKYIFIHHTAGISSAPNVITDWNTDSRGRIATSYVIGRNDDNKAFECFDSKYWASHLGIKGSSSNGIYHRGSVGIELCSWGILKKKGDKFFAWPSDFSLIEIPADQVTTLGSPFRGSRYYHKYPQSQLASLEKLLEIIIEQFGINVQNSFARSWFEFDQGLIKTPQEGIWSHTSVRSDNSDIHPDPEVLKILNRLAAKYN